MVACSVARRLLLNVAFLLFCAGNTANISIIVYRFVLNVCHLQKMSWCSAERFRGSGIRSWVMLLDLTHKGCTMRE